jgi:hypothetical protein
VNRSKESPWTADGGAWIRRLPWQRWRGWREEGPSRGHGGGRSRETPAATASRAAPAGPRSPIEPATRRARGGCGGGTRDARPAPARAMRAHPQCGAGRGGGGKRTPCASECVFLTPAARHDPRGLHLAPWKTFVVSRLLTQPGRFISRCSFRAGVGGRRARSGSPACRRADALHHLERPKLFRIPARTLLRPFPGFTRVCLGIRGKWPYRRG